LAERFGISTSTVRNILADAPGNTFNSTCFPQSDELSTHIGALCTRDTDVHKPGPKLGVGPVKLLRMINGRSSPPKAILAGLGKELDSDVRYLNKLEDEIRKTFCVGRRYLAIWRSDRSPLIRR
jgi:hypothetical protein